MTTETDRAQVANAQSITFSAKRVIGGYQPVADGNNPGGYFGGQRVFMRHIAVSRSAAKQLAETLYWDRLNAAH